MSATLADRARLAELPAFIFRVRAAMFSTANAVGKETAAEQSDRASRRVDLMLEAFRTPDNVSIWFSRAMAGWNPASPAIDVADTYADAYTAAGGTEDQKNTAGLSAIADATIQGYVTGAWDVLAGVRPWERS